MAMCSFRMVLGFDENPCFPVLFERGTHWRGTRGENIVNCRNSLLCWAFRIRGRLVTPKRFGTFTLTCVVLAIVAQSANAAITEYYSRAEWEAALGVVVVEDINTLDNDIAFSAAGENTSFGTHTFTPDYSRMCYV